MSWAAKVLDHSAVTNSTFGYRSNIKVEKNVNRYDVPEEYSLKGGCRTDKYIWPMVQNLFMIYKQDRSV